MEKRKYPRYKFRNRTGLAVYMLNCHKIYVLDISRNGICFEFIHKQSIECIRGDIIRIIMWDKETNSVVNMKAEVKHVENNPECIAIGAQFEREDPAVSMIINRLEYLRKTG